MKRIYWKLAIAVCIGVLLGFWSSHVRAAQFGGETYKITEVSSGAFMSPKSVAVTGEVKGFSCLSEVRADGQLLGSVKCYVLSK